MDNNHNNNTMTDSPDYRMYLELQFKELNGKLDSITKTVEKMDSTVETHNIAILKQVMDERRLDDIEHTIGKTNKSLEDAMFFVRHPKIAMLLISIIVAGMLISAWGTLRSANILQQNRDLIERIECLEKNL